MRKREAARICEACKTTYTVTIIQYGAATCSKYFEIHFQKVHFAYWGSMAAAAQQQPVELDIYNLYQNKLPPKNKCVKCIL